MENQKVVCDHCGELVFRRKLKIHNLNKYNTSSKEAYINSIVEIDKVSKKIATSWAEHGLFEFCKAKD